MLRNKKKKLTYASFLYGTLRVMISPMKARMIREPSAVRLARFPYPASTNVMVPYNNGPTMDETLPEKAKSPKNCPLFPSGVSSMINVLDVTHVAPKATPNKLPASQSIQGAMAKTAKHNATIKSPATDATASFDPIFLEIYP